MPSVSARSDGGNDYAGKALATFTWTLEGLVMKSLLITIVAIAGFSLAACEEKNPVEKAADKVEDVIDEAH
jgi:hypothetical protein